jgi:hypothetical protein
MALHYDLQINREMIGWVEIQRIEERDISNAAAVADVWSTYKVKRDGRLVGTLQHRYGDGAWQLNRLAAALLADDDLARRAAISNAR